MARNVCYIDKCCNFLKYIHKYDSNYVINLVRVTLRNQEMQLQSDVDIAHAGVICECIDVRDEVSQSVLTEAQCKTLMDILCTS